MTKSELIQQIRRKKSYLCVGLDTDLDKIPEHLKSHHNPLFEFNTRIIDATKDLCVAYKINTAFYEAMGSMGWDAMERTVNYISGEHLIIADAKRGDIGNTSAQYAEAFFNTYKFDAITVAPYMGEDSVKPFLNYKDKWTILLALTSNAGSKDFQQVVFDDGTTKENLYERVIRISSQWGSSEQLMYVVGATKPEELQKIRAMVPDYFFLVPGVGFQGGSLAEVSRAGMNKDVGLLVNASRAIIYASEKEDFAEEARAVALQYQAEMSGYLEEMG